MKFKNLVWLLVFALVSCDEPKEKPLDKTDLAAILNVCKGHAIVIAKGYNEGNWDGYRHSLLIKDSKGYVYEYYGTEYQISVGDTLK